MNKKSKAYIPKNFFNKNINESFVKYLMERAFQNIKLVEGNPNDFQPDYISDELSFDVTFACDDGNNNFIMKRKKTNYKTDDLEKDMCQYIKNSLHKKSLKNYKTKDVSICVLCIIDLSKWLDIYSKESYFKDIRFNQRNMFFDYISSKYIDTKIFHNIYILLPDDRGNWWIFDLKNYVQHKIELSDEDRKSGNYPYYSITSIE